MTRYIWTLFLFYCLLNSSPLCADALKLSFQEIKKSPENLELFQLEKVSIRGFLYKTENGEYVLSATPNLKTCCTGSKEHVRHQIYAEGGDLPFHPSPRCMTLEGTFKIQPVRDDNGRLIQLYHLSNCKMIQKQTPVLPTSLMTIGAIAISSILLCLLKQRKGLIPKKSA